MKDILSTIPDEELYSILKSVWIRDGERRVLGVLVLIIQGEESINKFFKPLKVEVIKKILDESKPTNGEILSYQMKKL